MRGLEPRTFYMWNICSTPKLCMASFPGLCPIPLKLFSVWGQNNLIPSCRWTTSHTIVLYFLHLQSMVEILGEKNATFLLTLKTRLLMTALIRMSQVGDFGVPPQRTMMQTGSGASARTPIWILGLQVTCQLSERCICSFNMSVKWKRCLVYE